MVSAQTDDSIWLMGQMVTYIQKKMHLVIFIENVRLPLKHKLDDPHNVTLSL